ncbi:BREX-1 system phosphatase PglZ type A [Companilactobacillus zhachilii]|uniref:BREX-1 system phosphatase PglZ type A n=1 Tax=Companilactobacillus zhachilii TaxID=2304606 RepID=UPI0040331C91
MADVDIDQVVGTLKEKFTKDNQFIFWFDDDGEFADSIVDLTAALDGVAQVKVMEQGHQVQTKLDLLALDNKQRVLIYAPYPQPDLEQNHLKDIISYSETFKADAIEILRKDLNLPNKLRNFLKDHKSFFGSKERQKQFMKYDLDSYENKPELAIMASIVKSKKQIISFFDILQEILIDSFEDDKYLKEFQKYGVQADFWNIIAEKFGYLDEDPQMLKFASELYLTMSFRQMDLEVPAKYREYDLSARWANVQTFMQQFNDMYRDRTEDEFANIANKVWDFINGDLVFTKIKIDDLAKSDVFEKFDTEILLWIQARLKLEDVAAEIDGYNISQISRKRSDMHYGSEHALLYQMMRNAWHIVRRDKNMPSNSLEDMINDYVNNKGYKEDTYYRKFIYAYEKANSPEEYNAIKDLVENIYTNDYLNKYINSWNEKFSYSAVDFRHLQRNFYSNHIESETNRVVVIISDAFRFEAAKELQHRLSHDDQITNQTMDYMITGLPSVTYMGMPSLLPNSKLDYDNKKLLVDGKEAVNLSMRDQILRNKNENSAAYVFDDLKSATTKEIKEKISGKEVIYIYHNQIDAISDNGKTEKRTFEATAGAIDEIAKLISRLRTNNVAHIIVTSDHGYIYRNDKVVSGDKIEIPTIDGEIKSQRYLISKRDIEEPGVGRQKMADVLNNDDDTFIYYPMAENIFKSSGSFNYVHGGSSMQEMIVPVLDIKTTSNRSTAHDVELRVTNTNNRITSLEVPISLNQVEPISATVNPVEYKVYFEDEDGLAISGPVSVNANISSKDVKDRFFKIRITLADQKYDKSKKYYLVIENMTNNTRNKIEYIMDIAIQGGFGFDI